LKLHQTLLSSSVFFPFLPCGIGGNGNQSVDVEVAKIALFWKTKNGYSHYIQSGFGRFLKKV